MADDDPFADLAATIKSPIQAGQAGSDQADPFADLAGRIQKGEPEPPLPQQTSALGAVASHAVAEAVPAAGVLAGAGAGAALGTVIGPEGTIAGGLIGGGLALAGGWAGGMLASKAQDTALEAVPDTWKDPLKQELETTEKEHPYMSMLGGLVPYIATMNPVAASKTGPVAATALGRLLSNPTTARVFGGTLQGGIELSQEYQSGQTPDWAKVAIATGFGLVFNQPNSIGQAIERAPRRLFEYGPRSPTLANVDAANVAGPGVTEEVATGELKRNEAAEQTAQDAARTEASIIGPRPEPDLHAAVERMNPEAVVARDHFEATAKTLRDAEVPNPALIAETQQALRGARQEVGDAYARAAESKGVEPVAPEVRQTAPNNANQRQAIADDVSRQLTAAGRPADEAEAHGQLIAERYAARASHLGVPVDELYRAEGARIVGPGAEPPTLPTPALTIAERQKAAFARGPRSMDANGVITEEPLPTIATPPTEANPEGGETLAPGALIGAEAPPPTVTDRRGNEWRQIGPNSDGQMLWEDQRGVRSIVEGGMRSTEPVGLAPGGGISTDRVAHPEYEPAPVEPATSVDHFEPPAPEPAPPEAQTDPRRNFINAAKDRLAGDGFRTILEARALAREHGVPFDENKVENKEIDELVERAVVERARELVDEGASPQETFAKMMRLYDNQPNLSTRTSTSIAEQAYSTPAPLAYVASRLAGIDHDTYVLEPTAGNGMLLMEADPRRTRINELNGARARSLTEQGFQPTSDDAAAAMAFSPERGRMDVVIANPPFGIVREGGKAKVFSVEGFNSTQIDHAISMNALTAMKADGKAVLIIGGVKAENEAERAAGYQVKAKRRFFHELLKNYKVSDVFTVSGDLYVKQGAGWPVDVITIEGRGPSERDPLTKTPPPLLKTWEEVGEKLNGLAERPVSSPEAGDRGQGIYAEDRGPSGEVAQGGPGPAGGNALGGAGVGRGEPSGLQPAEGAAPGPVGELDGSSNSPEPGPDGSESPLSAGAGSAPGQGGELRGPNPQPSPERGRSLEGEVTEGQTPYEPASQLGVKLDTLLPANLRNATFSSLDRLEREHGDVDHYVASSLGYPTDERGMFFLNDKGEKVRPFSAEQIDAIGLGISNIDKGEGFIIGDQTGIGKGRVVAGMISYAKSHGMVPVFVTEKPDLYGDMWRDLHDIGWDKQLGRPINMVMTNSSTRVPLDDAALEWIAERDEANENSTPTPPRRGAWSASQDTAKASAGMNAVLNGTANADVVFTTYDQMNSVKGAETDRRRFLRAVAPKSFLIMDEAHNAGGTKPSERGEGQGAAPRSKVFRDAIAKARSVMYSSATYAKNPTVMTLYSKTDMVKAVENPAQLPDLIEKGGVPLQQVVASMLARAGQYMRRERSFQGVDYAQESVPVSDKAYGEFTTGLRSVFQFDTAFAKERDDLAAKAAAELGGGTAHDTGTGETGASTTSFSSIMHNVISQMVMALKAEKAGDRAVEALKAGEKPIIGLSKTNASFIDDFLADQGIAPGEVANINFSHILSRYLERTRRVTLSTGGGEKIHAVIPIESMSAEAQAQYRAAEDALERMEVGDLPISPIDAMRSVIQRAGYTVKEVTGRKTMLDYSASNEGFNNPTVVQRPASETGPSGKKMTVKAFNFGKLDAIVLNRSGSTGISLHAGKNFSDQRPRRMIIAEADPNIDTHMQMLGRVHRTGQVVLPSYTHLTADIPAEVRPTAVLMRKMASLNANTTGAAKSRFSSEGVDFLNKYGDRVVKSIFFEDPMLMRQLGIHDIPEDEPTGLAAKATGRLTLLNPEDQEAFLNKISELYNQQIEALDASGTNDLEAKSMDLRARVLDSQVLKPATGPSPFQGEVRLDRTSIKSQGRAMAPSEAQGMIEDAKKVDHATRVQQTETAARTYLDSVIATLKTPEAKEGAREEFNGNLQRFKELTRTAEPGELVRLTVNGEEMPALVVGLSHKAGAKSPIALSSWNAMFAIPSGQRSLGVSLSRLGSEADQIGIRPDYDLTRGEFDQQLEEARKEGRENRFMISGNLLAGYDQVGGHGQIITHTMEDGSTRPAVLMNRQFNAKDFMSQRAIRFNSGEHIMRYLDAVSDPEVKSTDGIITVTKGYRGYEFEMPAAKALGGRYFTDSTVRDIFDNWKKQGSKMRATVDAGTATKLLDAFRKIDAVFETRENQDVAATLGDLHPAAEAVLNQGPAELEQGRIVRHGGFTLKPGDVRGLIDLTRHADASTFMEEAGHDFLHQVDRDVLHPNAPDWFKGDYATTLKWLGVTRDQLFELKPNGKYTPRAVKAHEKYAAGFQQYLWEGRAPSAALARVFERFKTWLMGVYKTIKSIPHLEEGLNDDMRQVFDRMLAAPEPKPAIIAPTQPARPTFSDIHAADIVEAQPGPASEAASDRIAAEATQREKEHVPAQQAIEAVQRTEAANNAGEATKRPDEEGFLEEGGGRSEPDSKLGGGGDGSGKELGRGGAGVSEGAATPAAAGARPVSGQPARPGAAAAIPHPESPDTFSRASGYEWSGNINRAYTDTPDHIWDVIRDTGEENDGFIGDRRGVVTNAETAQLADALGMTNDSLLQRHVGQAFNASEAFKARKLLIQSAYDVHAQMKLAATGNDEAVLNYVAARENHKLIQAQVAGITAEAGRALQSFKMISGEGADMAGAVDKIIRDGAGITLDQARREAKLGAAYTTPEQISRFMNDTRKPGFGDMIFEFWVNNLISGFATHSTYSIANQILSLMRAGPETAIAAGMGVARRSFGRTGERVRFGEVGRRLETMVGRGAIAGAQAAKESFLAGTTLRLPGEKGALGVPLTGGAGAPVAAASPTFQAGTFGTVQGLGEGFVTGAAVMQAAGAPGAPRWGFAHSNQGAIPDVKTPIGIIPAGTIQRLPSRSIAGIHSFFRGSNYLMEINALAYRRAMEEHEGMQQAGGGYNDIQFAARIDELKRNTPDDMMKAARDTATNATLMGAPGAVTQKLSQLVNAPINFPGVGPVKLFRFIDPFVNISSNIMKEGLLKRSPVGLLSQSIRDDLMGKNGNVAADMAAARMIAGTMLAATSVYLAHQGMVNGSGPPDRKLFNVWTQAGNLPHSVRIGDMWYGMNRLGPLGLLMSVAADLHDVAAALEPDAQGNRDYLHAGNLLQHAFTHNILDESFLRGPADLLSAIENPATDGERWIKDMGTSFLPFSVNMAQMARATDPYAREARTFMDAIKAKTPGLSESLWPRVSIWGQPMPNHDAVIHSGVTAIYKTAVNPDPVDAALLKLGLGVAPPRPVIQGVKLTDQQYHDYATLTGHMRYQRLQALVNSQIFRRSPGSVQHDLITSTVSQSKTAAQGWLFARYPDILRNAHKNKMDIRLKEDEGED